MSPVLIKDTLKGRGGRGGGEQTELLLDIVSEQLLHLVTQINISSHHQH